MRWDRNRPRVSPASGWCALIPAGRGGGATQEIDYGRRGYGYVFGAFVPATGETLTPPYPGRTTANWVDFLDRVDDWLAPGSTRIYAVLDNLFAHRAPDVLLWALAHPRWEFVFQPTKAASLNLIEPWWKILRSLALKGRRFASWDDLCQAVEAATGTGMPIAIPVFGGAANAVAPPDRRASPLSRLWHELTGWTTKRPPAPGVDHPLGAAAPSTRR